MLAKNAACLALRNIRLAAHEVDESAAVREDQGFPHAAIYKISLSSDRLQTVRQSRSFSFCGRSRSVRCSVPISPIASHCTYDLPPIIEAVFGWKIPFMVLRLGKSNFYKSINVQRGADCICCKVTQPNAHLPQSEGFALQAF